MFWETQKQNQCTVASCNLESDRYMWYFCIFRSWKDSATVLSVSSESVPYRYLLVQRRFSITTINSFTCCGGWNREHFSSYHGTDIMSYCNNILRIFVIFQYGIFSMCLGGRNLNLVWRHSQVGQYTQRLYISKATSGLENDTALLTNRSFVSKFFKFNHTN